jgi:hypothetical protein
VIVIVAKGDDDHAVVVAQTLIHKLNEQVFIFDTSQFPMHYHLEGVIEDDLFDFSLLSQHHQPIEIDKAKSIWWRRPQSMIMATDIQDYSIQNFTLNECISGLYGLLTSCEALWVNDLKNSYAADYKPFQLKTASRVGLRIPDTLITNNPNRAIEFWRRHDGNVIYKAFNEKGLIWSPTRRLTQEYLSAINRIQYAPVIFQPLIAGAVDVRVTVVGRHIFATEFQIMDKEAIDYRIDLTSIPSRPHYLPENLQQKIRQYMDMLGLVYGGLDFRVTPEGAYIFFEINTAGEFMYIQKLTGQPISDAMAELLAYGNP